MRKLYAEFEDPENLEGPHLAAFDIVPDLADAVREALCNVRTVAPPRHARSFNDLTETIAQTSRLIQHLEIFRELAMVAADRTSPHADRKAVAIAAAMPPSRLYRVLEKHGRPKNRAKAYDDAVHQAIDEGVEGIGAVLDRATEITDEK
jgi:type VI protein secretion system component VasK